MSGTVGLQSEARIIPTVSGSCTMIMHSHTALSVKESSVEKRSWSWNILFTCQNFLPVTLSSSLPWKMISMDHVLIRIKESKGYEGYSEQFTEWFFEMLQQLETTLNSRKVCRRWPLQFGIKLNIELPVSTVNIKLSDLINNSGMWSILFCVPLMKSICACISPVGSWHPSPQVLLAIQSA